LPVRFPQKNNGYMKGLYILEKKDYRGVVFNIQRYSIHDGPGIRTVVFLKGCFLKCLWCSNPESQDIKKEIAIYPKKCTKCLNCIKACPVNALKLKENSSEIEIDRSKCIRCGKCTQVCSSTALRLIGRDMYVEEILDEVMKDEVFYRRSGGGVTFSGGEPLMQVDFLKNLLIASKKEGLHTAIETSGFSSWQKIKKVINYLDLILFDIKHMDSEKHKQMTGVKNKLILNNARRIAKIDKSKLIIRIPFIPKYNNSENEIKEIFRFAKEIKVNNINILPYHNFGESKYINLGREYKIKNISLLEKNDLESFLEKGKNMGLNVFL